MPPPIDKPTLPTIDVMRVARGCVLPATSHDEVKRLLTERVRLCDRVSELDSEGERLARAVQRVGGLAAGPRQFTGAPPILIASTSELGERLDRLSREMQDLTATISAQELKLQDLDRLSRRRHVIRTVLLLVVIATAAAAAVYLAVR